MEIEEGKVEIDEIDLEFCLIHVLYGVYLVNTNLMNAYRIENIIEWTRWVLGAKQVLVFPNLFTYYG